MMKNFLLMILSALPLTMTGQNVETLIGDLKSELQNKPDPRRTVGIYGDLAWYYANVSIDSALHYGTKAINAAKILNDSTVTAQIYSDVGAVYFRKGDFDNSKDLYLKAYKIRKAQNDQIGVAKVNINLANLYIKDKQYEPGMKAYFEALDYFEKVNNAVIVNATKSNIGLTFTELKNFPKAIKYLSEAIAYEEQHNLTEKLCVSCLNIGNAYLQMKDTIKALKFYDKSLKACKIEGNVKAVASVYNNIGSIKAIQNKAKEANALYDAAEKIRKGVGSELDDATLQLNRVRELLNEGRYSEAKTILLEIEKVFKAKDSQEDLMLTYNLLLPVYAYYKSPDSVKYYFNAAEAINRQILAASVLKQTAELEAKYQTAQKEKQLLVKEAEVNRKNTLFYSTLVLAFFVILIVLLIYRQQKLKNKQQEQEFSLKTAIAQIETQNQLQEQRLAISRDLHDNIGAQLTFIISSVDNIKYAFDITNSKLDNKLKSISNFTKSTIVELRDTIWAMNNNEITFEDLHARILNFIEKAKEAQSGIDFQFVIADSLKHLKLTSIRGMNIYRTIQEAVNNAMKHANATEIAIEVSDIGGQFEIAISDNGKGFSTEVPVGNGLHNMQKRIEDIDGVFAIESEVGLGTKIRATIKK